MDVPIISVIIPIYNVEKYIVECLESLLEQSCPSIEIIFIDDCGQDSSSAIVEEFLANHLGFNGRIIHHEKNKGLSGARNTGLRDAKGDYVLFLDSDDLLTTGALNSMIESIGDNEPDIVVFDYRVFGNRELNSDLHLLDGFYQGDEIMKSYSEGKWYVMAWNKLCKRDFLFDNSLYFEEGLIHEDQIWSFKVAIKARTMQICNRVTYLYRVRDSSIMTGTGISKDAHSYVKVYDAIQSFLREEKILVTPDIYNLYEGKRSGILYSILVKKNNSLYKEIYHLFRPQRIASPLKAFSQKIISGKNLVRDYHYCLPERLGRIYKQAFYLLYYKSRNRKIEGAVWE